MTEIFLYVLEKLSSTVDRLASSEFASWNDCAFGTVGVSGEIAFCKHTRRFLFCVVKTITVPLLPVLLLSRWLELDMEHIISLFLFFIVFTHGFVMLFQCLSIYPSVCLSHLVPSM